MNFLALIITLLLQQFGGVHERVQRDDWFRRWQIRVSGWNIGGEGRLLMALLPALVLAQLLLDLLQPMLFGLLWIVLAVVLLLYSLGRADFEQLMARYRSQCHAGDFEGAYLDTLSDLGVIGAVDNLQSPQEVHARVQRGFFYEGYQRWFPVLFYFVVFGPVGALGYRLLQLCRQRFEAALVERCLVIADWVPARLLAATFALTGNFVRSKEVLFNALGDLSAAPEQLLYAVGTAALDAPGQADSPEQSFGELAARQNEETGRLLSRSAICWVALIALIVLMD
jgi:AmpE protein